MQTGEDNHDLHPGDKDDETATPPRRKGHKPVSTFTPHPSDEPDEPNVDGPPPKVGPPPM